MNGMRNTKRRDRSCSRCLMLVRRRKQANHSRKLDIFAGWCQHITAEWHGGVRRRESDQSLPPNLSPLLLSCPRSKTDPRASPALNGFTDVPGSSRPMAEQNRPGTPSDGMEQHRWEANFVRNSGFDLEEISEKIRGKIIDAGQDSQIKTREKSYVPKP
ncbi:MAG: hypothetical protein ACKVP5_07810 [Aestuariivirga sp.]